MTQLYSTTLGHFSRVLRFLTLNFHFQRAKAMKNSKYPRRKTFFFLISDAKTYFKAKSFSFSQASQRPMSWNQENRQDNIQGKIRNFGKNQDIVQLIPTLLSKTESA